MAESHAFLEAYALLNGTVFLIAEDREASQGNWVYVRALVEWYELF